MSVGFATGSRDRKIPRYLGSPRVCAFVRLCSAICFLPLLKARGREAFRREHAGTQADHQADRRRRAALRQGAKTCDGDRGNELMNALLY